MNAQRFDPLLRLEFALSMSTIKHIIEFIFILFCIYWVRLAFQAALLERLDITFGIVRDQITGKIVWCREYAWCREGGLGTSNHHTEVSALNDDDHASYFEEYPYAEDHHLDEIVEEGGEEEESKGSNDDKGLKRRSYAEMAVKRWRVGVKVQQKKDNVSTVKWGQKLKYVELRKKDAKFGVRDRTEGGSQVNLGAVIKCEVVLEHGSAVVRRSNVQAKSLLMQNISGSGNDSRKDDSEVCQKLCMQNGTHKPMLSLSEAANAVRDEIRESTEAESGNDSRKDDSEVCHKLCVQNITDKPQLSLSEAANAVRDEIRESAEAESGKGSKRELLQEA